ncbi:MAG: hypothetical protein FJZ90_07450 [Chloroflexi bacterium]|nr:hypothetical protein [Chloroflexota bacterium]
MQIQRVDPTRAADRRRFIAFPFRLYWDCPQWVPPILSEMQGVFRQDHPFYEHSEAAFFLAEEGGETVGRIAALDHRLYNGYHDARAAFFYYFDVVDDEAAARALFAAASDWAAKRGLTTLVGPKGMLRADGLGLLIEGFEHLPGMGIPYNYPYYDRLMRANGFEKEIDYVSGHLFGDYQLPERFYEVAERIRDRRGFAIKRFASKAELRAWVPAIQRVNNEAFTQVWGYYPMSEAEAQAIARRLLSVVDYRLIKLVMKGEELAGFLLAFPDLSRGIQRAGGRLWPLGWWHILREFRRTEWLSINGLGLLPQYQGLGANAILYTELARSVRDLQFRHADLAQVAEDNLKSLGEANAVGVEWYKRHRIYRQAL